MAISNAEAELRSMAHGICEIMWMKMLLEEIRAEVQKPILLHCDNKAAISIAHNLVHHDRTKHVEVDRYFIKEKIEERLITVNYIPTTHQTAKILTNALYKQYLRDL